MPAPRFRFRSTHAGLTLLGRGWSAQFRGGRFATDDVRTARGVAKRAAEHPEYEITLVRGSDKPAEGDAPAPTPATPAPTEGEGS